MAKIAKIFAKIIFIFCCIGFGACLVGIISLAVGAQTLQLGGVSVESILQNKENVTVGTLYANLAAGLIMSAGTAVSAKFAQVYFKNELKDGTPFTIDGAHELLRVGIIGTCMPVGTQILAEIVHGVLAQVMLNVGELKAEAFGSVGIGVSLIIMALICKSAAEQLAPQTKEPSEHLSER